jgi:hypothetical protein
MGRDADGRAQCGHPRRNEQQDLAGSSSQEKNDPKPNPNDVSQRRNLLSNGREMRLWRGQRRPLYAFGDMLSLF